MKINWICSYRENGLKMKVDQNHCQFLPNFDDKDFDAKVHKVVFQSKLPT